MRVMFVSSEVAPFSKTGGLADVVASLPKALVELGLEITTVSPWYDTIAIAPTSSFEIDVPASVPGLAGQKIIVGETVLHGVRHWFVRLPGFARERMYGFDDDVLRFVEFCHVAVLLAEKFQPNVVHLNDWQSGYVAPMLRFGSHLKARVVYTIHNLEFLGRWNIPDMIRLTNLPARIFVPGGLEFFGDASAAKAGMVYSDVVNTVSPTYAKEIQTQAFGCGLDGLLRRRHVLGILNGLDTETWNPRTDEFINRFGSLPAKRKAQVALRREFGLAAGAPVLAMVTRLSEQKGLSLVLGALPEILRDWRLVVLGEGNEMFAGTFLALMGLAPKRIAFRRGFDEALAHRIYAGADAFLMPSRFEPCGLAQLIAMRYGTLPIVRRTGGLADTVPDDYGYGFEEFSALALKECLQSARADWDTPAWLGRASLGMSGDYSWLRSAREYLGLYKNPQGSLGGSLHE